MNIKILATTDIHGSIFPTDYTTAQNHSDLGLAKIASAIKQIKDTNSILIDNGDAFQGSPLMTYALENTEKNPISEIFNMMNYDYFNLGNHDFNYGPEVLFNFIDNTQAKLLTSNIFYKGKALGKTYIHEIDGQSIALIGVTTHYIPNWEQVHNIKDFSFKDAYTHLKEEVQHYKDKVDYVIGVYHGGLEKDPKTGDPTETLTTENQGYQMSTIDGLDVLITGHQHRSLVEMLHDTLVTQSTFKAKEFVKIQLQKQNSSAYLIPVDSIEADEAIITKFQDLQNQTQTWLDQSIGYIKDMDLLVHDENQARIVKHPIISFLNQIQLDKTGADIAAIALFNDAKGFNQSITIRDIVATYPYPNTMVVKKMNGKILKEMLEWSAKYFTLDKDGKVTADPKYVLPKPEHYNYDMFDGIEYTIKVSNPIGSRIQNLTFKGKSIQDDDEFTVAMNNYRAAGGGDYEMVLKAPTVKEISEEMIDTMIDYLKVHSPVVVNHQNNILVVK